MITVPQDVTLAARETKEVTAHVTVPQAGLTGISSGAFTFRDKDSQQHAQAASAGMAVKNVYAFQIAVLMRQQKDTTFTFNQIQRSGLQLHTVAAGQVNARNVIKANLQNPLAKYINDFTVTKDAFNWWSLLAVLLAVLITVFWFILWKRRRDDEEESEQN